MSYTASKSITINSGQVPSTQTNFPVLISGTYPYLATTANGGMIQNTTTLNSQTVPADLIFTSDSGGTSNLIWEVASYNAITGTIEVWVNVPSVATSSVFYMFYGNASITTYQCTASDTWDTNVALVTHLANGVTLTTVDSSQYGVTMTPSMSQVAATAGQIDGGASIGPGPLFPANIVCDPSVTTALNGNFTMSLWLNISAIDNKNLCGTLRQPEGRCLAYNIFSAGDISTLIQDVTVPQSVDYSAYIGQWAHVAWTYDGTNSILYINGSSVSSVPLSSLLNPMSDPFYIGDFEAGADAGQFNVDELHVVSTNRSADWIQAEYNNQSSPAAFYTIGSIGPTSNTTGMFLVF